jgi:pyruvate/2-oxoglutarate dehydrogenase complex dihydrolipoamide dehydrogenase (E3) component
MGVDAIVIGGGPAGEVRAGALADGGLRAALVERELVGGGTLLLGLQSSGRACPSPLDPS